MLEYDAVPELDNEPELEGDPESDDDELPELDDEPEFEAVGVANGLNVWLLVLGGSEAVFTT